MSKAMGDLSYEYLTIPQLRKLDEHTYSSIGTTYLDKMMQKFWCWIVLKIPLSVAPNMLTLVGLIANIITALILFYYSPDAKQNIPSWALLLCAIGLFIYQTLDACDGKHARRTDNSSQLGEIFDHGCDAISTIFVNLSFCLTIHLGEYPNGMLILCLGAMTLYYTAHWQTYVTGTMQFGSFDVTEAQVTAMGIFVVSAIFGSNIWSSYVPVLSLRINAILLMIVLSATVMTFFKYLHNIFTGGIGKNGSSVADTSVLSPFIPIALIDTIAFIVYQKSSSNVFVDHPCVYYMLFGIVTAKVTNKLLIANICRSEMDYFDSSIIGPLMLIVNQYFNTYFNEYYILWAALIYSLWNYIYYSCNICVQIAHYLKIHILTITPKSTSGKKPLKNSIKK